MTNEKLAQALRYIAETPKQGEPEPTDSKYTQVWDEELGKYAIEALHDQIDLARKALDEAGIAYDRPLTVCTCDDGGSAGCPVHDEAVAN